VRPITRNGNDFSDHFPFIAMAVKALSVRSCLIDGGAIVCYKKGLAVFESIRGYRALLELDGKDTCGDSRLGNASGGWRSRRIALIRALLSTSTMRLRARSCFARRAGSAVKGSCRNGLARHAALAAQRTA